MSKNQYRCRQDTRTANFSPCAGWMRVEREFVFGHRIWLQFKCSKCGREATDWKHGAKR